MPTCIARAFGAERDNGPEPPSQAGGGKDVLQKRLICLTHSSQKLEREFAGAPWLTCWSLSFGFKG